MEIPVPREFTASYIEGRARRAGLTMEQLCDNAGVAVSTFYRWRMGITEPRLDVYRRLLHASAPRPRKYAA